MLIFLSLFLEIMYSIKNKELELIDSKKFGTGVRTPIGKTQEGQVFLIKDRKSRLIMKDGKQISDQIKKVKLLMPGSNVALATCAPICSKTTQYFADHEIDVYQLEK